MSIVMAGTHLIIKLRKLDRRKSFTKMILKLDHCLHFYSNLVSARFEGRGILRHSKICLENPDLWSSFAELKRC